MTKIILIPLLLILLTGCSNSSNPPPTTIGTPSLINPTKTTLPISTALLDTKTSTALVTAIQIHTLRLPSPTNTRISTPTPTETAVPSLTPLSPSLFDPIGIVTHTPAPPAQCPEEDLGLVPDVSSLQRDYALYDDLSIGIISLLNSSVTRLALINAWCPTCKDLFEKDLTNDGVPELVMGLNYIYVFGCRDKQYQLLLKSPPDNDFYYPPVVLEPQDMNRNGIPELTFAALTDNAPQYEFRIFEWDGVQFQSLIQYFDYKLVDYAPILVPKTMEIIDTDDNGTRELYLVGGVPIGSAYINGLPFREETWIYMWNGANFMVNSLEYAPPQYRFQAVLDGDRASLAGNYDRAVAFYQEAIFSDQLDWWSDIRRKYLRDTYHPSAGLVVETPSPDPYEYPNLAAYSRFRIMLLHVIRGWLPEAQTIYETLQEQFPQGQTGHVFSEMAAEFWNEYQTSKNISLACDETISYASAHQDEILKYINVYAWQNPTYEPEDLCPFKKLP